MNMKGQAVLGILNLSLGTFYSLTNRKVNFKQNNLRPFVLTNSSDVSSYEQSFFSVIDCAFPNRSTAI